MLLTISTTHPPATDLGYLLHKHPARCQSYDLSFGRVHVFYPEATDDRCSVCLLLDVDPVGIVRGKGSAEGLLPQYVKRSTVRGLVVPERGDSAGLRLAARAGVGVALGARDWGRDRAFSPCECDSRSRGRAVPEGRVRAAGLSRSCRAPRTDEQFPAWGESPYFSVTVSKTTTLSELLTHLYVLIPVFDSHKHYFVGDDEMEKLDKGKGWLEPASRERRDYAPIPEVRPACLPGACPAGG